MIHLTLGEVDRGLAGAERSIALTERCRPINYASEQRRVLSLWERGVHAVPRFDYPRAPDLSGVEAALGFILEGLTSGASGVSCLPEVWTKLYVERTSELLLDASLVGAVGTAAFALRAAARFGPDPRVAQRARELAETWAGEVHSAQEATIPSDDDRDPRSLLSHMRAAIGARRLPVRIEIAPHLPSTAAASDEVVYIRPGILLRERDAARIVEHEIKAHVMPRLAARRESIGLFAVGTARSEDEEGRALAIEQHTPGFDAVRRAELGRRHLAALQVHEGATWRETVDLVMSTGASHEQALGIASRAHRGGGLGREVVYLDGLLRYRDAAADGVPIDSWMSRGRIGIQAAVALHDARITPGSVVRSTAA